MNVGIIGYGNMGGAIVKGLIKNEKFNNNNLFIYNRTISKMDEVKDLVEICENQEQLIQKSQIIILAIKPNQYKKWLKQYSTYIKDKLFISIGAGITQEFLSKYLSLFIITMPNVGSEYNLGYTVICKNTNTEPKIAEVLLEESSKLFNLVGKVKIIKEEEIENYIGLVGSSPAYFFEIIRSMSQYFEKLGYDKKEIEQTLAYMMKTSATLIEKSNHKSATDLVDGVCSKGGCTIKAIEYFRENKLEDILTCGIKSCVDKANDMKVKKNDK